MPLCSHFKVCGGCSTQDIPYEKQLLAKELFVKAQFPEFTLLPILASPLTWQYRNKMEFSFSESKEREKFLGLMMTKGRGRVVNLTECHLCQPWFTETVKSVKAWWIESDLRAYFPPKNSGHLRTLTIRSGMRTHESMVILTIAEELPEDVITNFIESVVSVHPYTSVILRRQIVEKKCPTRFEERVIWGKDHINEVLFVGASRRSLTFKVRPSSFFQPNVFAAEVVYNTAMSLGNFGKEESLYDLYCGTGTVGMFASFHVKSVVGIEKSEEAIADAGENLLRNQITNMRVIASDMNDATLEKVDSVMIDPPRVGLEPKALKKIIDLRPKKIVYISCNPKTQGENVKEFCKAGYGIEAIQPIDQFPHTSHVENIVVLRM